MLFGLVALATVIIATVIITIVTVSGVRRSTRDNDALRHERDQLVHSVRHDSLSGLLNRFGVIERLTTEFADEHDDFVVLYLDIDRFKSINDTLGHSAGDRLLATIGRRLDHVVGSLGHTGRIGGDEFVVVLDHSDEPAALALAERLTRSIVEPIEIDGRLLRVSASVGIATGPWTERSAVTVLEHANHALHRAKEHGRDRVEVFTLEMRALERRRALHEVELRRAIERGDVRPFFQPEFDVVSGRLVGASVVPRWFQDDESVFEEGSILCLARDASTVERSTASLLREARPIMRRLQLLGLPDGFRFRFQLPGRITPRAWRDGQIMAAFQDSETSLLTLDVAPNVVTVDPENAQRVLADLRHRGARICLRNIDDLATVGVVDLDEIRVAGELVRSGRPVDDAVVHAIAGLADRLGLTLSADDVSTSDEVDRLVAIGCRRQQGTFHGRPMTPEEFQTIVESDLAGRLIDLSPT